MSSMRLVNKLIQIKKFLKTNSAIYVNLVKSDKSQMKLKIAAKTQNKKLPF